MAKMTGGMLMRPRSRNADVLAAGLLSVLRGGSEATGGVEDLRDWELFDLEGVLVGTVWLDCCIFGLVCFA